MSKKVSKKKMGFTLDMVIYPFDVRFSFNESDREVWRHFKKKVKKRDKDSIKFERNGIGRCVMFEDSSLALIRMVKVPSTPGDFKSLQHEITHYVMFLLYESLHMPHNLDTTEAYCYLTGYITKKVYKKLPKFRESR